MIIEVEALSAHIYAIDAILDGQADTNRSWSVFRDLGTTSGLSNKLRIRLALDTRRIQASSSEEVE